MALFKKTYILLARNICNVNSPRCITNYNQSWSQLSVVPYRDKSLEYVKNKFSIALTWYEEVSGLRHVREAQQRVLLATEGMKNAQIKRRNAKTPITELQKRLQDLQPELRNTPRHDDSYLYLIKEEHGLLKSLKLLQENVQEAENQEREAFEELMTSLRTSHEAERFQAEKTKYWSIILSITATIIGIVGSNINNRYKMRELKSMLHMSSDNNYDDSAVVKAIQGIQHKIDKLSSPTINNVTQTVPMVEDEIMKKVAIGAVIVTVILWIFSR